MDLLLEKSANTQNISLTLAEKTSIPDPFYLFEFDHDMTHVKYFQVFTDVSAPGEARVRSNLFNIEEVASGAGANQITLGNVGLYTYTIYQQSSPSNLDPTQAQGVVQRGQMRLIDDEAGVYIQHTPEVTYVAHEQ